MNRSVITAALFDVESFFPNHHNIVVAVPKPSVRKNNSFVDPEKNKA